MALILGNTSISSSTSETVAIAAADTNARKHKVKAINLVFSGTISIQLLDGVTPLTGAMEFASGDKLHLTPENCGGFQTSENTALNLTIARTGGNVRGNIEYVTAK